VKRLIVLTVFVLMAGVTHAQEELSAQTRNQDSTNKRYFIGSSFFVLGNFFPDPPSFYQFDYGYRLTQKDAIIIQAITWSYHAPLGIPYGPSFESTDESYPGSVRAYGVGVGYQRFLRKGFYSTVHATPFLQSFLDPGKEKIQQGFQLFLQLRLGYQLLFFKDRFYVEPSIAFNYWPINTNFPASFAKIENKWPNYFLFEPGLNFGIKF
jgi:hypothetical protein